jgi:hypothetical protein
MSSTKNLIEPKLYRNPTSFYQVFSGVHVMFKFYQVFSGDYASLGSIRFLVEVM